MSFRFSKSKKIGPLRVNFSKSGIGWSVGSKGARFTKKAGGGTRSTFSLPGTGLSYVSDTPKKNNTSSPKTTSSTGYIGEAGASTKKHGCLWWLFIGWWWWFIELCVWLFGTPLCIAIRYIKYLLSRKSTEKFDTKKAAESDMLTQLNSMTAYNTQFYKTNWFFIVCCVFAPVLGIAIVLLKRDGWSTKKKAVVCGIIAFWFLILGISSCGNDSAIQPVASNSDSIVSSSNKHFTLSDSDSLITSASDIIARQTTETTTTTTVTTTTITTTTQTTTTTKYVEMVWIPQSGSKYHRWDGCSNMNSPREITREEAERRGYEPCGRCY